MNGQHICTAGLRLFLDFLARRTSKNWRHLFVTTNWDFLLQREINAFIPGNVKPGWLTDSHVSHLNGTIEDSLDHPFRSPFLLPEDPPNQRTLTPEANIALNRVIWQSTFVVVGMSFECPTDRSFLRELNRVEDDLPVGESTWLIVNPDSEAVTATCERIQIALPYATVRPVCLTFNRWRDAGFPDLMSRGALSPEVQGSSGPPLAEPSPSSTSSAVAPLSPTHPLHDCS